MHRPRRIEVAIAAVLLAGWALWYWFGFEVFSNFGLALSVILFVLLGLGRFLPANYGRVLLRLVDEAGLVLIGCTYLSAIIFLVILAVLWAPDIARGVLWAATRSEFAPLLIMASFGLYLLRVHLRLLYGIAEILFGIIAISICVTRPDNGDLAHLMTALAGAYIIVRGLDNFDQGLVALCKQLPTPSILRITEIWFDFKFNHPGFLRLKMEIQSKSSKASPTQNPNVL